MCRLGPRLARVKSGSVSHVAEGDIYGESGERETGRVCVCEGG